MFGPFYFFSIRDIPVNFVIRGFMDDFRNAKSPDFLSTVIRCIICVIRSCVKMVYNNLLIIQVKQAEFFMCLCKYNLNVFFCVSAISESA